MMAFSLKASPRSILRPLRALAAPGSWRRSFTCPCSIAPQQSPKHRKKSAVVQLRDMSSCADASDVTAREQESCACENQHDLIPYSDVFPEGERESYFLPNNRFCYNRRCDAHRLTVRTSWLLTHFSTGNLVDFGPASPQSRRFSVHQRKEDELEESESPAALDNDGVALGGKVQTISPPRDQGGNASWFHTQPESNLEDLKTQTRRALKHGLASSALTGTQPRGSAAPTALELEELFHKWNSSLKQVKDPASLRPLVELVDELVRLNHRRIHEQVVAPGVSDGATASATDETFAVFVGISAWARVSASSPDAAKRAQQLFELLPVPDLAKLPSDLQSNFVWHRRNVYNALLLTWSRCSAPSASQECDAWLSAMKAEEAKYRYQSRLVNVHAYNYVLASHAKRANVARVEELWSEMANTSRIQPNAHSYDAWIKAYQSVHGTDLKSKSRIRVGEIFRDQLRMYRSLQVKKASAKPMPLTLARVLSLHTFMPDEARALLEAALELEKDKPECRGLVNIRHVALVLNALTGKDRVEEAEQLLSNIIRIYETDSNKHLCPDKKAFGIVMDGYAQRRNALESLQRVEAILANLEERLIKSYPPANQHFVDEVDATVYNILMTAYFRAWPNDAVKKIQLVIQRMERVANEVSRPALLPDAISYTILIKALARRAAPGYEHEVENVLRGMEQQSRVTAKPTMRTYFEALLSWAHSENPNACARVRDILNAIESPSTACFNVAIGAHGRRGELDEAIAILKRMKQDSESGRNHRCRPDSFTYTSVLLALGKPARESSISRWEMALECFDDMTDSFLKGDTRCRPNQNLIAALLEVLRTSDEVSEKHVAALEVLKRFDRLGLPQGVSTAIALISACGGTLGSKEVRFESTKFIMGLVKSLPRAHLTDEVYRAALESCHMLLLDDEEDRERIVSEVFALCKEAGHVSLPFLHTLRTICPPGVYTSLTGQDAGGTPTLDSVPREWKLFA